MDFARKKKEKESASNDTIEIAVETEEEQTNRLNVEEAEELNELEKLQIAYEELDDKYLRLAAEYDNYQKRQDRILEQMIEQERNNVVGRLLEIATEIERAMAEVEKNSDPQAIYDGITMVSKRINELLKLEGIEAEDPTGKLFDPLEHEAVAVIPVDNNELDNIVIQIMQPCFKREGKLVCPAKVIVGKFKE